MVGQHDYRLAVIGAGIAGAATAETAARRHPDWSIDVFEKSSRVGGRIVASEFGSEMIEASALGFWDRYTYLTEYLDRFGLDGRLASPEAEQHTVNRSIPEDEIEVDVAV